MNTKVRTDTNHQGDDNETLPAVIRADPPHATETFDEVRLNALGLDDDGNPMLKTAELVAALAAARTISELEMAAGMRFGECAFEIRRDGTFLKLPKREDKLCIQDSLSRTSKWLNATEEHSTHPSIATRSALTRIENEIGENDIKCLRSAANMIALASRKTIEVDVNDIRMELTIPHRAVLDSLADETAAATNNETDNGPQVIAIRDLIELISTTGQAFLVTMSPLFKRLQSGCIVALRSRNAQGSFRLIDDSKKEEIDGNK